MGIVTGGTYTDENKDCFSTTFFSAENAYNETKKQDYLEDILKEFVGKNISINITESAIYAFYDKNIESLKERFLWAENKPLLNHNLKGNISIKRQFYKTKDNKRFDYINIYIGETNLTSFIRDHAIDKGSGSSKQFLKLRIENY